MAGTIAYDKPVRDFIAQLNETGHVTNTAYRKTSVTFHHNGGRLSLQGCLDVWKTRPASAHFDVDGQGALGQYVKVNEYAWACGNTQGNKESIHIEMANATLAPDWLVADVTWREAARLGGWLFARVIGVAPTRETVHVHHDWKSTTCAGPFIDKIREQLFQAVLAAYNEFAKAHPSPSTPPPTPTARKSVGVIASEVIAGQWGNGADRTNRLRAAGYDAAAVQAEVNRRVGGSKSTPSSKKTVAQVARDVINGHYGNEPQRSQRLSAAGYSPSQVQAEVNRILGAPVGKAPTRPSVSLLATQVIAGQWGNGPTRAQRLTSAGFDAAAVQAEVNRRLLRR